MQCPKCQYENREGANFCRQCGAVQERICPKCQHHNEADAQFCDECGAKLAEVASTSTEVAIAPKLEDMQKQLQDRIPRSLADRLFSGAKHMQGEYRLLTAVFAEVVDPSEMAWRVPLDQYVDVVNDCFKMIVDIMSVKYGGSINHFIGNCVLTFFSTPVTHENDAERAIFAALDIRDGTRELDLDISVGINTWMTYVDDTEGDLYLDRGAWAPDMDFAKKLQEAAKPGEIWVGASTYRLTSQAFDYEGPIDIEVSGMERRRMAYLVLYAGEHQEKFSGIHDLKAKMIGREREFADLKRVADNLISGQGNITSIIGEAGLGKSRLALELKVYLKDKDVNWYEGRSISIGQTVNYWPFLDILRTHLNLIDVDSESDVAQKLKESMTDLFPHKWKDILPFLGHLLSIKFGNELDDILSYFTPEQIRHQMLMRLRDVFIAIARREPLLLILEDLHWSDDSSMDLISLLMDELATNPLMLLCIYRPEEEHRCRQIGDVASRKCLERYTEITLKKLSIIQSCQLVESLLEVDDLSEPAKDIILRKSEGNPFFIHEVIRYLIDRELVYREGSKWKARRSIEDVDVPETIQSVLLSGVDRLEAETRYVLQCTSVIGRLFRYRLLDHLAQHEKALEEHLSQLAEKAMSWSRLGQAYRELRQDEKAIESWERALDIATGTRNILPPISASRIMRIYSARGQEDMVMFIFSRIMKILASLEMNEEYQAWALIMPGSGEYIYAAYKAFRDGYYAMGKEKEFPDAAKKTLEDLLGSVNSRPQRAWYHSELMHLYLEQGDTSAAENHAREVTSIIEEMDRPDYMARLYPAYLLLGDIYVADELAYRFLIRNFGAYFYLETCLNEIEVKYRELGQELAFQQFCIRLEQEQEEELRNMGINQLFLKPVARPEDFQWTEFVDSFKTGLLSHSWEWIDPGGISSYAPHRDPGRMEISAIGGSELGRGSQNAPRLSQPISGDFAVETHIGNEKLGGLFVWTDKNGITFQRWRDGLIVLTNRSVIAGRGVLDAESLTMRLERKGRIFYAYCSGDGEKWYRCGWAEMEMEDPVQVGIFASCPQDVAQGITTFDYVKIFRQK